MTIGNLDTARILFKHFEQDDYGPARPALKGFRKIGSGCYRTAYLEVATDTVYKIGEYDANVDEAYNARRLRRRSTRSLGFRLYIPETRTYAMPSGMSWNGHSYRRCVSAQEYAANAKATECAAQDDWMDEVPPCNCAGKGPICFAIAHQRIMEFSGLSDIHYENVLIDNAGVFWLIDLAS